ncbi:hypothetical protein niasHT_037353 [Heterodera trifolii]|uniref:Plasma membrane proteolipid 3 n=1 Tax=Heterodera trifolii TaxID=157864 RepID=A0ABD2J0H1_9BILA
MITACFINAGTCIYDINIGGRPKTMPIVDGNDAVDIQLIRAKRFFQNERSWNMEQILEAILCVFIPPAAVLIHGGHDMLLHMVINIVLWVCGWIPGMIHAFWYCFYRD